MLSIGRFVEKKGLVYALEAVANAHRAGRKLHYTIVGDGELRPQIEQFVSGNQGFPENNSIQSMLLFRI